MLSTAVMGAVLRFPRVVLVIQAALVLIGGGTTPFVTIFSMALMLVTLTVVALRYGPRVVTAWWAVAYAAMLGVLAVNTAKTELGPIFFGITSFAGISLAPVVLARYVRGRAAPPLWPRRGRPRPSSAGRWRSAPPGWPNAPGWPGICTMWWPTTWAP